MCIRDSPERDQALEPGGQPDAELGFTANEVAQSPHRGGSAPLAEMPIARDLGKCCPSHRRSGLRATPRHLTRHMLTDIAAPVPRRLTSPAPPHLILLRRVLGGVAIAIRLAAVLQRGGLWHGDDVVAGIDEVDVAGHAGGQIGEEIECRAADLVEGHAAAQGRVPLLEGEHLPCLADAGAGQRADRASGDRIDADRRRPEIDREITHRRLERGLGHAHDIVIGHGALPAVVGQGQHGAAGRHQRRSAFRHLGEREARDQHGAHEIVARGVGVAALELVLVREGDGVDQEVE